MKDLTNDILFFGELIRLLQKYDIHLEADIVTETDCYDVTTTPDHYIIEGDGGVEVALRYKAPRVAPPKDVKKGLVRTGACTLSYKSGLQGTAGSLR